MTFQIPENIVTDLFGNGNVATRKIVFSCNAEAWTWEYETPAVRDVEFGGGICVKVDSETGATNSVAFMSVDCKPGAECKFQMSGFDVSTVQDGSPLGMWLVVSDTPDGVRRHEAVVATLDSETKILTVTLPAEATANKNSLFIFGIDNKE